MHNDVRVVDDDPSPVYSAPLLQHKTRGSRADLIGLLQLVWLSSEVEHVRQDLWWVS